MTLSQISQSIPEGCCWSLSSSRHHACEALVALCRAANGSAWRKGICLEVVFAGAARSVENFPWRQVTQVCACMVGTVGIKCMIDWKLRNDTSSFASKALMAPLCLSLPRSRSFYLFSSVSLTPTPPSFSLVSTLWTLQSSVVTGDQLV